MLSLKPALDAKRPMSVLCIGAHSDDIEIGALGTVLTFGTQYPGATITWAVFSASGNRLFEAKSSAIECAQSFAQLSFVHHDFDDAHFPSAIAEIKAAFGDLRKRCEPDIIFTHHSGDAHQDHRVVSEVTWQTFRNNFILEYEIPKYEGDLGTPSVFFPLSTEAAEKKLDILDRHFASQQGKPWFTKDTFRSLMRLRGIQSRSPSGLAEAFHAQKLVLGDNSHG